MDPDLAHEGQIEFAAERRVVYRALVLETAEILAHNNDKRKQILFGARTKGG